MGGFGKVVSPILRSIDSKDGEYLSFWCPGCDCVHSITVNNGPGDSNHWGWNGSYDTPTFTPSILYNVGGANRSRPICHSYVTDGRMQMLADCTHALAGQTVDLPEFPR
jgi:hypothetical protein